MIRHLVRGLRILGERWYARPRRWVAAGTNWLDTGLRLAMLAGGGWALAQLLLGSLLRVGAVALVVCVLALRAATKAARGAPTKPAAAEPEAKPAGAGLPAVTAAELVALARDLTGTAPGVHLAALAAALSGRHGGAWATADVRALCAAHGVPVRPSVRGAGGRVSPGVHRADLPPSPGAAQDGPVAASGGVVVAGRPATTGPTTPPATGPSTTPATPTVAVVDGLRIESADDPDNPARTHVSVLDQAGKGPRR